MKSESKIPKPTFNQSQSATSTPAEGPASPRNATIAPEQAVEIRRLVHDLSNGLEIIIQSSYLLSTSELPEDSRQWVKLLEQGVQQTARVNQELRAYILEHS